MGQSQLTQPIEGFDNTATDKWRKQQLQITYSRAKEEYYLTDSM